MKLHIFITGLLCVFVASCTITSDTGRDGRYSFFGKEPVTDISLGRAPSEALVHWARTASRRNLTLVHLSMQDGLAPLSPEKAAELKTLVRKGQWEDLVRSRSRGASGLVTAENYLSAAVSLGIPSRIFWVIPDRMLEYSDAERRARQLLESSGGRFARADIENMKLERGCVSGRLRDTPVSICSLETLPQVDGPVLLDLDIDFIRHFSEAKRYSTLRGFKTIYDNLAARKIQVAAATISGSEVPSLFLHRHLGAQAAEALRDPEIMRAASPPDLWLARDAAAWAFAQGEDLSAALEDPLKRYPADGPLVLIEAVGAAVRGGEAQALPTLETLCAADWNSCSALLYISGELKKKRQYDASERYLLAALKQEPNWPAALKEYGDLLFEKKSYGAALLRYQALAANADGASVQFAIGDCHYLLGQKRDALNHYRNGLSLYDESLGYRLSDREKDSLMRLAQLYDEQKDPGSAKSVRNRLGSGTPN